MILALAFRYQYEVVTSYWYLKAKTHIMLIYIYIKNVQNFNKMVSSVAEISAPYDENWRSYGQSMVMTIDLTRWSNNRVIWGRLGELWITYKYHSSKRSRCTAISVVLRNFPAQKVLWRVGRGQEQNSLGNDTIYENFFQFDSNLFKLIQIIEMGTWVTGMDKFLIVVKHILSTQTESSTK